MLVLSRKRQESVVVENSEGNECLLKVTVIDIRGNRVKLGFEAADDISIHRTELWNPRQTDSPPRSRDEAAKEATEQWDDDGGAAAPAKASLATSPATVRSRL